MSAVDEMIAWREGLGLTLKDLSKRSGVSIGLLELIENGGVTHPDIAARICEVYELPQEYAQEFIPKHRRQNTEDYDPDKYKQYEDINGVNFRIWHRKWDEGANYAMDMRENVRRRYHKKGDY